MCDQQTLNHYQSIKQNRNKLETEIEFVQVQFQEKTYQIIQIVYLRV